MHAHVRMHQCRHSCTHAHSQAYAHPCAATHTHAHVCAQMQAWREPFAPSCRACTCTGAPLPCSGLPGPRELLGTPPGVGSAQGQEQTPPGASARGGIAHSGGLSVVDVGIACGAQGRATSPCTVLRSAPTHPTPAPCHHPHRACPMPWAWHTCVCDLCVRVHVSECMCVNAYACACASCMHAHTCL